MRPMASSAYTENRRAKTARKYVSQCKKCKFAIYEDEARVWLTSPMGLSHKECPS